MRDGGCAVRRENEVEWCRESTVVANGIRIWSLFSSRSLEFCPLPASMRNELHACLWAHDLDAQASQYHRMVQPSLPPSPPTTTRSLSFSFLLLAFSNSSGILQQQDQQHSSLITRPSRSWVILLYAWRRRFGTGVTGWLSSCRAIIDRLGWIKVLFPTD